MSNEFVVLDGRLLSALAGVLDQLGLRNGQHVTTEQGYEVMAANLSATVLAKESTKQIN
jgi:hypothetical protein